MGRSIAAIISEHIRSNRTELPVFSGTARRLQEVVSQPEFEIDSVEAVIGNDPVLSSAVLRMANSSFYSSLEKVATISEAVMRLGVKRVVNLAGLVSLKSNYQIQSKRLRPLVEALWLHSVACAAGSEWLARRLKHLDLASEAFMAGMLHDIGKLMVLRVLDDLIQANKDFDPPDELIHQVMVRMHTTCGEELLRAWNMPEAYVDVVVRHHAEELRDDDALLAIVRLVDLASNKLGLGLRPANDSNLAATIEARVLELSDIVTAELEMSLEDTLELAASAG